MANDMARAAAIQQTRNSPGFFEMQRIGDDLIAQLKEDLVSTEDDFASAQREARGAIKFWNKYKAAITGAATTQIEAETEIHPLV